MSNYYYLPSAGNRFVYSKHNSHIHYGLERLCIIWESRPVRNTDLYWCPKTGRGPERGIIYCIRHGRRPLQYSDKSWRRVFIHAHSWCLYVSLSHIYSRARAPEQSEVDGDAGSIDLGFAPYNIIILTSDTTHS